jgi:hypothetical protein
MIVTRFNSKKFAKEMNNLMEYSVGFLEGAKRGKIELLNQVGEKTKEILGQYLDSNARVNPELMHHVYEWYLVGSPEARLFNLNYSAAAGSLSVNATFTQSTSIKNGSTTPFYNKAMVMERGISVSISPRNSQALAFEDNGQQVFVKGPVTVNNPGGSQVAGGFEKVFSEFFEKYFTQSFMKASGLDERLRNPIAFVKNFSKGKSLGKSLGNDVGYRWIAGKAGM